MTKSPVMAPGTLPVQGIAVPREEPKSPMTNPLEQNDNNLAAQKTAFYPKMLSVKDNNVQTERPESFITNPFEGDDAIPEPADRMGFYLQHHFNKDKSIPVKQPASAMANQSQTNHAAPIQKPTCWTTNPHMRGSDAPIQETPPPSSSSTNVATGTMYSSMKAVFMLTDEMTKELLAILSIIASSGGATVHKDDLAAPLLRLNELIEHAGFEAQNGLTTGLRLDRRDVEARLRALAVQHARLLTDRDSLVEKWQEAALVMHLPADPDFFARTCRMGEDLDDTRWRIVNAGRDDHVERSPERREPQRTSGEDSSSQEVPTLVQSDGWSGRENTLDGWQDSHPKTASKRFDPNCDMNCDKGALATRPGTIPSKCTFL